VTTLPGHKTLDLLRFLAVAPDILRRTAVELAGESVVRHAIEDGFLSTTPHAFGNQSLERLADLGWRVLGKRPPTCNGERVTREHVVINIKRVRDHYTVVPAREASALLGPDVNLPPRLYSIHRTEDGRLEMLGLFAQGALTPPSLRPLVEFALECQKRPAVAELLPKGCLRAEFIFTQRHKANEFMAMTRSARSGLRKAVVELLRPRCSIVSIEA
jgi:hypothetical protein